MGYSAKIIQRTDYIRSDGTASLYLRFTIDRSPARIPLDIAVLPDDFLAGQQKVKMATLRFFGAGRSSGFFTFK